MGWGYFEDILVLWAFSMGNFFIYEFFSSPNPRGWGSITFLILGITKMIQIFFKKNHNTIAKIHLYNSEISIIKMK